MLKPSIVATVGKVVDQLEVTIGPQFLNLFSEHLYSSANKAFEELVSNSWDADADVVYIHVPKDLSAPNAAVWVLDNGSSMDVAGLRELWHVANSPKRISPAPTKRSQIGKFGIGKLATYLLCNELTYVCRAKDGKIRSVTMDYRRIDEETKDGTGEKRLHIDPIPLKVREMDASALEKLIKELPAGTGLLELLNKKVPKPKASADPVAKEFGAIDPATLPKKGTWTLALLTSLKKEGREMQTGWIRRLLRTALPLGSNITISFNDEALLSSKIDVSVEKEWRIGPGLDIGGIELPDGTALKVTEHPKPYPHVKIEGVPGEITGTARLFKDRISGGKSEEIASSNGFFVNIRGRVVNPTDPYFGLENLSHSAWSKFRAAVRADFLDPQVSVNRKDLKETPHLQIFRAFLRSVFNKARFHHDKLVRASWPNAGDVLTDSWSSVPMEPFRHLVAESIASTGDLPDFIDAPADLNRKAALKEWEETAQKNPGSLISNVEFESRSPDEPLVKYNLAKRRITVNASHPFTVEHSETHEQQQFVRNVALIDLLTDAYTLDIGIDEEQHRQVRDYRDQIRRLMAQVNRRSGAQIASLLITATSHAKGLERILGDAIEYLGFTVRRYGQSGEPEGVATAPLPPDPNSKPAAYEFTYDAKSTGKMKAKTGNLGIAGLARHRKDYEANFTLVVAPDFQVADALLKECGQNHVTPMRAKDLATLVMLCAAKGPLDLNSFRDVFKLTNPDHVANWVAKLAEAKESAKNHLSYDLLFAVLEKIGYSGPNSINISVIADRISTTTKGKIRPSDRDVANAVRGLAVVVPSLIRITNNNAVFLSTSPAKLREAIRKQLATIPAEYLFGLDTDIGENPAKK